MPEKLIWSKKREARIKGYRSCTCHQGHLHDSRFEAGYCDDLHLLQRAGEIKGIKNQVTYDLKVNGRQICTHRVDFVVTNNAGIEEVHECKGFGTEVWRIKKKLFEACYPEINYIVITVRRR